MSKQQSYNLHARNLEPTIRIFAGILRNISAFGIVFEVYEKPVARDGSICRVRYP